MGISLKQAWYWLPRILGFLLIVFIELFALDVFAEGYNILDLLVALFMHSIPAILLTIALIIAWKWESLGGGLYVLLGLFYIIMARGRVDSVSILVIAGIPFIIGILFILHQATIDQTIEKKKK
jgi:hypothetical protein